MKIAGRKNDGAWFRTNKVIHSLSAPERTDFIDMLIEATGAKAAATFADLQSLAAECGIAVPDAIGDSTEWLTRMATDGIPRQIWNGKLSFTTYGKVGAKFVANYQSNVHFFAKDLRRACKYWLMGRRQMNDLMDVHGGPAVNPGGLPDASRPDAG